MKWDMRIETPVLVATGGSPTALSHRRLDTGLLSVMPPMWGVQHSKSSIERHKALHSFSYLQ